MMGLSVPALPASTILKSENVILATSPLNVWRTAPEHWEEKKGRKIRMPSLEKATGRLASLSMPNLLQPSLLRMYVDKAGRRMRRVTTEMLR